MKIPRALRPVAGAAVVTFLLWLMACGSQDNLYDDPPATTAPRCGEANDPRCEP